MQQFSVIEEGRGVVVVVGLAKISACVTFGERWQSPSVNTLTGILLKVLSDSDIDLQMTGFI